MAVSAHHPKHPVFLLAVFIIPLVLAGLVWSKTVLQIVPTLTISEEYSDNYLLTRDNTVTEYITTCALGFSVGFLGDKHSLYLNYAPEYKDYRELDDRDRIAHNVSLEGEFNPTKHTHLTMGIIYDGDSDNYQGESRNHIARAGGTTRMSKYTVLTYSHTYSDQFSRQARTGTFQEHTLNTSRAGLDMQYGKDDSLGLAVLYESDKYDTPDADAYTLIQPSGYLSHWFNPKNGMDTSISYGDRDFSDTNDYVKSFEGDVRYLRKIGKHLQGYLKYRHSYSDTESYTHHIFHPSFGVDWEVTKDAGISVGLGALFHEWSNENEEGTRPFVDLNAYKDWEFSRKGSLSFTASSGYSEAGSEAASLGYNIYYQAGAQLNYQLSKKVSSNLFGSFRLDEYDSSNVDRKDKNFLIGAGITWQPLKWLELGLNCSHLEFDTSDPDQDDYKDNRVFFSITLVPETPVRMKSLQSRESFESDIYSWDR